MTTSDTRSGTSEDRLEQTAARLDQAMARVDALGADERVVVADALAALDALHKDALTTVVRRLRDDGRGRELLYALVDEPEVRMVLSMHGIIRPDPVTLAHRALERVRPTLASHGGDVELDRIEEGVAHVRLHGACNGCSMSAVTLRDSVEEALRAGVPGLVGVEVVPNDPTTTVIPLESLTVRTAGTDEERRAVEELRASGWCPAGRADALLDGTVLAVSLTAPDGVGVDAIVVRAGGEPAAYVNACAHQGRALDGALVDATEGTLTCPWHGLCYDAASGECLTLPGAQLSPLPLRVAAGQLWIRPGEG